MPHVVQRGVPIKSPFIFLKRKNKMKIQTKRDFQESAGIHRDKDAKEKKRIKTEREGGFRKRKTFFEYSNHELYSLATRWLFDFLVFSFSLLFFSSRLDLICFSFIAIVSCVRLLPRRHTSANKQIKNAKRNNVRDYLCTQFVIGAPQH